MNVDFYRLRIQIAISFNSLIKELNRHVDGELILDRGIPEGDIFVTGDIYDQINSLRNSIATLLSVYDDKNNKEIDFDLEIFASKNDDI